MNEQAGTTARSGKIPWGLLAIAALLVPLALAGRDIAVTDHDPARHYADNPAPLLTSYDGYAFLRQAEDAPVPAGCCALGQATPQPALSFVIAATARISSLSPARTAFYLPTLLALLLPLAVYAWARRFYAAPAALAASLAAGACPYFLRVTAPGQCDTDCLIPTLFLAAALALHRALRSRGPARLRFAVLYVLTGITAFWWWKPGGALCLLLLLLALLADPPGKSARTRLGMRLGLVALLAALGALTISGVYRLLPAPLAAPFDYVARNAALALGLTPGTEAVARSVRELRPESLVALARDVCGSLPVFGLALLGVLRLFRLAPKTAVLLAPLALAGGLALRSQRLTLLFFPLAALGLGAALDWLLARPPFARLRGERTKALAALGLAACLLLPALLQDLRPAPAPPFDRDDDRLALAVRRATPKDTVVWSWWDDGYFLRYRTGRAVFFDGGSQSAEDCFVAAWPLAASDPDLAADWIRYFAAHGVGELGRLAARFGSRDAAVAFLLRLFSSPRADRDAVLADLPGPPLADAIAYFFPDVSVCLVLRRDILSKSGFWLAYAAGPQAPIPLRPPNHVDVFAKNGLVVDAAAGKIVLPQAARAKGYKTVPTVWDVETVVPDAQELAGRADPILFYGAQLPVAAIADRAAGGSLAFRLLIVPDFKPPRFARIAFTPGTSGAWEVR